jgi:hypothetical protein
MTGNFYKQEHKQEKTMVDNNNYNIDAKIK